MKLRDLIELFSLDDAEGTGVRSEEGQDRAGRDTSSLAEIARILRELDGQYDVDSERR